MRGSSGRRWTGWSESTPTWWGGCTTILPPGATRGWCTSIRGGSAPAGDSRALMLGDGGGREPRNRETTVADDGRDAGIRVERRDEEEDRHEARAYLPPEMDVRDEDLEPHAGLRYIARMFKILAILLLLLMV